LIEAGEHLPVVCFCSTLRLLRCFVAACNSSSTNGHGELEPTVPHRTRLTARSEAALLSDAVVSHTVHKPSDELHPDGSFWRTDAGRLSTNASPVETTDTRQNDVIGSNAQYRLLMVITANPVTVWSTGNGDGRTHKVPLRHARATETNSASYRLQDGKRTYVLAKGKWQCSTTGKVTVGLASHWPWVTDSVAYPPTG